MDEIRCIHCGTGFTPYFPEQQCCTADCAFAAEREWEYPFVLKELDKLLVKSMTK